MEHPEYTPNGCRDMDIPTYNAAIEGFSQQDHSLLLQWHLYMDTWGIYDTEEKISERLSLPLELVREWVQCWEGAHPNINQVRIIQDAPQTFQESIKRI